MMSEKNITVLINALEQLGFARLEQGIRLHIYFGAAHFTLLHKEERSGDKLQSVLYFERKEDGNYECTHYDATLRPCITIDEERSGADATKLDKLMHAIQWKEFNDLSQSGAEPIGWTALQDVFTRMEELSDLREGAETVNLLKLKFWMSTTLEAFIPNFYALKKSLRDHATLSSF